MWTLELIELMASGYAPQKAWHKCEKCRTEYQSVRMAWNCYKGHFRSYERVYAKINLDEIKHDVIYVNNQPICGHCASKIKEEAALCTVRMATPPECSRCHGVIRDKPLPEVKPGQLPPSERHHDLVLHPSKQAEYDALRYSWYKGVKRAGLNSIGARGTYDFDPGSAEKFNAAGAEINAGMFKDFGPYQPDGNAGLVRTETGYLEVDQKELVEVSWPKT